MTSADEPAISWHSVGLDRAHAFRTGALWISACGIGPGEPEASSKPRCQTCERRLRLPQEARSNEVPR